MKIKFPKTITIGDTTVKVETDLKRTGGEFYTWSEDTGKVTEGKLIIGTKLLTIHPTIVLSTIIHELKEIIQVEQHTRYKRPDESTSYEFHYTHKEHTDLCSRLASALSQFIE